MGFYIFRLIEHKIKLFIKKKNYIFVSAASNKYVKFNNILWQEGLYIDFLQKLIIDIWIKKFLIISAYLINEKLIYKYIINWFLIYIMWPLQKYNVLISLNIVFFFTLLLSVFNILFLVCILC